MKSKEEADKKETPAEAEEDVYLPEESGAVETKVHSELPSLKLSVKRDSFDIELQSSGHDINEAASGITFLVDKFIGLKKELRE